MKSRRRRQVHLHHKGLPNRKGRNTRKLWMRGPGGDYVRCGEGMDELLSAAAAVVA